MTDFKPRGKTREALIILAQLPKDGRLARSELADMIGCDCLDLITLLAKPRELDLVKEDRLGGISYYRLGEGKPVPAEPDRLLPVKQTIVSVSPPAAPAVAEPEPVAPTPRAVDPIPFEQRRSVRVSLWPGGGIVIEGEDVRSLTQAQQAVVLDALHTARAIA
ncbi:hypothetical protein [Methylibium petroleiphilum]